MKSPLLHLQKALWDRLKSALTCPVYDDFPEQENFPYVITGELRGSDWSAKGEPGQEDTASIHVWSRYPGKKECLEIMDQIIQALSPSRPLELEGGFRIIVDHIDTSEIIVDMDGKTRHGIVQWKFKIEEILS